MIVKLLFLQSDEWETTSESDSTDWIKFVDGPDEKITGEHSEGFFVQFTPQRELWCVLETIGNETKVKHETLKLYMGQNTNVSETKQDVILKCIKAYEDSLNRNLIEL